MNWLKTSDHSPPTGEPLFVCWSPKHLSTPIGVAKHDKGRGWYADGERVPTPLFWAVPKLPQELMS